MGGYKTERVGKRMEMVKTRGQRVRGEMILNSLRTRGERIGTKEEEH
jgi:hypothetical protein